MTFQAVPPNTFVCLHVKYFLRDSLTLRTNVCEIDVDEASGNFASSGNALITHNWSTQNVIVQCYVGGELIHADVTLADATVALHFDKIPATNPTVVIMEAAGTAHTTTVPTYPE